MLTELEIRNLGPIRAASIEPSKGMTAITGETGAGKSMLLNAIRMITGASMNANKVSPDADKATASGAFDYDDDCDAVKTAVNHGVDVDMDSPEIIMKRILPASGRGKCLVNGDMETMRTMREIGDALITIHGQSDQVRISNPVKQLRLLDDYANDNIELAAYKDAYDTRIACEKKLNKLNDPDSLARSEFLKESIKKIKQADLKPGEHNELKQQIKLMENNANRMDSMRTAVNILDGDDNSIMDSLRSITRSLDGMLNDEQTETLDAAVDALNEITRSLYDDIDHMDAFDLDAANERIMIIEQTIRRYGGSEESALEWLDNAENELSLLEADDDALEALEAELESLKTNENKKAKALTLKRTTAAKALSAQVSDELAGLAMPDAKLEITVNPMNATSTGHDKVEFMLTAYKGAPSLPIGKSASGGELSRIMLALELAVASKHPDNSLTFVFDEIDSGVGGSSAVEIGRRLAKLAESSQVIIVTHLAQVAAYADTQYVLSKGIHDDNADIASTVVMEATGDERIREIARMLSGDDSEISMEHAKALLDKSRKGK